MLNDTHGERSLHLATARFHQFGRTTAILAGYNIDQNVFISAVMLLPGIGEASFLVFYKLRTYISGGIDFSEHA